MYIIDTNVISELRKGARANANVVTTVAAIPISELYISVVTLLELKMGILSLRRKNAAQAEILDFWLHRQVIPSYTGRILHIDMDIALRCAALHVPIHRPERDALIAATALALGFTILTRNTKDFLPMGVHCVDPWETPVAS